MKCLNEPSLRTFMNILTDVSPHLHETVKQSIGMVNCLKCLAWTHPLSEPEKLAAL